MKKLFLILLVLNISCKNEVSETKLFLDFSSGISENEFNDIAKTNPELKPKEFPDKGDYDYNLFLKSTSIVATIHPEFGNKGLEKIFLHGQVKKSNELIEIENMLKEKYNDPKLTKENTLIRGNIKSTCLNWSVGSKEIRFCTDSFPLLGRPDIKNQDKILFYFFEIHYIDNKIKNIDLNNKKSNEL